MERFQIRRKISDTMLGAVYEGQLRHSQRRSSVALKCSSIAVANKLRAGTQKRHVDDPQREWAVVEQLIAVRRPPPRRPMLRPVRVPCQRQRTPTERK
ncbi:hypothetical protein PINS_up021361 [Pythium insidiosum]|nr:hypothetical protein PINS_up021361 [Pythium insidiosum]